ncbi:SixA phosphatase family protein [Salinimicrobium soli]|uniref:SixA phosphatase family protein n=1 Tax=Salinimicrobium soli TaxID=1254399 RepID=UPI003AABDE4B
MKRLILVRHGKSSWDYDVPDDERPLKERAFNDADTVISAVKDQIKEPFTIWSSYAKRALTTAKIFQEKLDVPAASFEIRDDLYTFNGNELLNEIKTCEDQVQTLMVFGHNPAMTQVVNHLGDQHFDNIPTTGLTWLEFEVDSWEDIRHGKTILYLFPKNLS